MNETTVTVTGWVGGDVTLRRAGEHVVATFRMATRSGRWRDGEFHPSPPTWHQVKAWRDLGANAAASIAKGDPVVVHGRLVAEQWDREDGTRVTQYVLVASAIGHNLAHGRGTFARTAPPGSSTPTPLEQSTHPEQGGPEPTSQSIGEGAEVGAAGPRPDAA